MPNYYTKWARGASSVSWDEPDKAKVRHMLSRGKSIDFIHRYTGMPVAVIEAVERNMNSDGTRRGKSDVDRFCINKLNSEDPIAPDRDAILRQRKALARCNRNFVAALKAAA